MQFLGKQHFEPSLIQIFTKQLEISSLLSGSTVDMTLTLHFHSNDLRSDV